MGCNDSDENNCIKRVQSWDMLIKSVGTEHLSLPPQPLTCECVRKQ